MEVFSDVIESHDLWEQVVLAYISQGLPPATAIEHADTVVAERYRRTETGVLVTGYVKAAIYFLDKGSPGDARYNLQRAIELQRDAAHKEERHDGLRPQ